MIESSQIKAARAMLDWSQQTLADKSGVSLPTIKRIESAGPGRSSLDTINAIKMALETAGIEFIPENGGGPGVRLREKSAG